MVARSTPSRSASASSTASSSGRIPSPLTSRPPASGLHTSGTTPSRMQASNVPSRSGSRWAAEYSGWFVTSGNGRWACSAATWAGVWLLTPTSRIEPSARSAASVSATSAGWVSRSGRWTCHRSMTSTPSRRSDALTARRRARGLESYGVGGTMPPLVASTMRSRSPGALASTLPSSSSHDPKPVPPQSRP